MRSWKYINVSRAISVLCGACAIFFQGCQPRKSVAGLVDEITGIVFLARAKEIEDTRPVEYAAVCIFESNVTSVRKVIDELGAQRDSPIHLNAIYRDDSSLRSLIGGNDFYVYRSKTKNNELELVLFPDAGLVYVVLIFPDYAGDF